MIGMSETQLRSGLLWWRNTLYKELFDKAITIHITTSQEVSLSRIQKRESDAFKKSGKKHLPKKPVAPSFIEEAVVITPALVEVTEIVQVSSNEDSGSFGGEQTSLFSED